VLLRDGIDGLFDTFDFADGNLNPDIFKLIGIGPSYLIDIQGLSFQKHVFSSLKTPFSRPKSPL